MKHTFTLVLVFAVNTCFAQKQNVYFFKNNGTEVTVRDSADYIRILREPDSGAVNYKITEYYKDGKPKLVGESSTVEPLTFENQQVAYYPNGKRQSIENFKGGKLTEAYSYYPTGRLQAVREYPDSLAKENQFENHVLVTYNDTTGKAIIVNGEGYFAGYDPEAVQRYNEGKIAYGKREGEWKGNYAADKVSFTEVYKNGKLVSGTCVTADNKKYDYNTENNMPVSTIKGISNGGDFGPVFNVKTFVSTTVSVRSFSPGSPRPINGGGQFGSSPSRGTKSSNSTEYNSAVDDAQNQVSKNSVHGSVKIEFIIDKTGVARNFVVAQPLDEKSDQLALKFVSEFIKKDKKIIPGILYGRPVDIQYIVPVKFQ
jgi:antitoxin component YwqK of YwqJK toxin-antitoxin module